MSKSIKMLPAKRIDELLKYTGLRKNSLATKLGFVNSGIFNHIQSGRNGISPNLARKICGVYPEISENWLLSGNGVMLYPKHSTVDNEAIGQQLKGIFTQLEKLNELHEKVDDLQKAITSLTKN